MSGNNRARNNRARNNRTTQQLLTRQQRGFVEHQAIHDPPRKANGHRGHVLAGERPPQPQHFVFGLTERDATLAAAMHVLVDDPLVSGLEVAVRAVAQQPAHHGTRRIARRSRPQQIRIGRLVQGLALPIAIILAAKVQAAKIQAIRLAIPRLEVTLLATP
ncbi:MAG: hypothetical protein JNK49_04655 [Planctomycetes bacterium]|nr:hypothetical protein [Planctomycetota bacterium]